MKHLLLLLISLCWCLSASAAVPSVDSKAIEARSLVFTGPDSISKYYRIPAVVTLADGTIVAVADRRLESNADLPGDIDVVCRRSTDGGKTWSDVIEVAVHDEGGGYGDPALGMDRHGNLVAVFTHGNGLWQSTKGDHARIFTSRSTDGGLTWSKPADITKGLFSQERGKAPQTAITAFASSGRILTCRDGSMWFVLVVRPDEKKWGPLHSVACRSTDGGKTWRAMVTPADRFGDESKLVELPDGKLLMSIRNRRQGYRKFSVSDDRGLTWSKPELSTTLPDPGCNGDIIALPDGTLIQSINNSHDTREKISLFASKDLGKTWKPIFEVCPTPSCYSALTLIDPETIGVLSEEDADYGGQRLWFTRIKLSEIL